MAAGGIDNQRKLLQERNKIRDVTAYLTAMSPFLDTDPDTQRFHGLAIDLQEASLDAVMKTMKVSDSKRKEVLENLVSESVPGMTTFSSASPLFGDRVVSGQPFASSEDMGVAEELARKMRTLPAAVAPAVPRHIFNEIISMAVARIGPLLTQHDVRFYRTKIANEVFPPAWTPPAGTTRDSVLREISSCITDPNPLRELNNRHGTTGNPLEQLTPADFQYVLAAFNEYYLEHVGDTEMSHRDFQIYAELNPDAARQIIEELRRAAEKQSAAPNTAPASAGPLMPRSRRGALVVSGSRPATSLQSMDRFAGAESGRDVTAFFETFRDEYSPFLAQEALRLMLQRSGVQDKNTITNTLNLVALASSAVRRGGPVVESVLSQIPFDLPGLMESMRISLDQAIAQADGQFIEGIVSNVMKSVTRVRGLGVLPWTRSSRKYAIHEVVSESISVAANGGSIEAIVDYIEHEPPPRNNLPQELKADENFRNLIASQVHRYASPSGARVPNIIQNLGNLLSATSSPDGSLQTLGRDITMIPPEQLTPAERREEIRRLRAEIDREEQAVRAARDNAVMA